MKILPIVKKIESVQTLGKAKKQFHQKIVKGDFVSVIYYDIEKEQVRLQQFTGVCTKFHSKGFNTKIHVSNVMGQTTIQQQFFFYSPSVLDVAILRKK